MREIKFRGKRVDNGEWVYGMLDCIYKEDGVTTISYLDNEGYYCEDKVIPETTGQFTGLLDKNGKQIYEGDIVVGENYMFPCYDNRKLTIQWNEKDCGFDMSIFNMNEIEVIGNIHDNKELLNDTRRN